MDAGAALDASQGRCARIGRRVVARFPAESDPANMGTLRLDRPYGLAAVPWHDDISDCRPTNPAPPPSSTPPRSPACVRGLRGCLSARGRHPYSRPHGRDSWALACREAEPVHRRHESLRPHRARWIGMKAPHASTSPRCHRRSLRRLRTDYIDLYQLHADDPEKLCWTKRSDALDLDRARRQGCGYQVLQFPRVPAGIGLSVAPMCDVWPDTFRCSPDTAFSSVSSA